MNGKKVIIISLMVGLLWLMRRDKCRAWQPPVQENEDVFLSWYEENKDTEGAVYSLRNDMKLSKGSKTAPILLNGQGHVTIDANDHVILIDSDVVLDNPNLIIWGNASALLIVRAEGELTMERIAVDYEGKEVVAVYVNGGRIRTSTVGGQVFIRAKGNNVKGIQYDSSPQGTLSNLSIDVEGEGVVFGIGTELTNSLTIDNCEIRAVGTLGAYGVYGGARNDFLIKGSKITAECTQQTGERYSVYSVQGTCNVENSVLNPELVTGVTYVIMERPKNVPVYVETGVDSEDWELPGTQDTIVRKGLESENIIMSLPVKWEMPEQGFDQPGYRTVTGSYISEGIQGAIVNPDKIVPRITVICLPPENMFLIEYEIIKNGQKLGVKCLIPFPYGAERMEIEYSIDGIEFSSVKNLDIEELYEDNILPDGGLYSFYLQIPSINQKIYMRAKTYGESIFAGTSAVWTIETGHTGSIPEDADNSYDGDRGGQGSNASPSDVQESHAETEGAAQEMASPVGNIVQGDETGSQTEAAKQTDETKDSTVNAAKADQTFEIKKYISAETQDADKQEADSPKGGAKENSETSYAFLVLFALAGMAAFTYRYGKKIFKA